jgi:glycosyltransferase involved in cell wall biosynthesis
MPGTVWQRPDVPGAKVRVAFTLSAGAAHWTGGYNYLSNMLRTMRLHHFQTVEAILFVAPCVPTSDVALLATELPSAPQIAEWLVPALRQRRTRDSLFRGSDQLAYRAFRDAGIQVVFEAGEYFGWRFPIPALTWVADFQSHHLPQYFSRRARWRTFLGRRLQLRGRRLILLSSQDAAADCARFYPASRHRCVVVPFAVQRPVVKQLDETLKERLKLPARFFYLPNQFWKHKNHIVIVDALAAVRQHGSNIAVVASGSPTDHRNPGYFEELKARIDNLGLQSAFLLVGMVSRDDVIQLALQSVAIINPSLFEGWSTTVEEAKVLGVPLVLSSLRVHREQAGAAAIYFKPHSPACAASAMLAMWNRAETPGMQRVAAAVPMAEQLTLNFARGLLAAIERAHALSLQQMGK